EMKPNVQCALILGGLARDQTNPFIDHEGERTVRFSSKATQDERALDVRFHLADTDMTPEMIADVNAIKTIDGVQVFEWGGSWRTRKDCMHFELDLSPEELAPGIDHSTVKGWTESIVPPAAVSTSGDAPTATAMTLDPHIVIARDGLRLRSGPSATAEIKRTIPEGTRVNVLAREGQWAQVDLEGDGRADGFMFLCLLKPVTAAVYVRPV